MKRKYKVLTNLKSSPAIYKIYCEFTDKIYIGESVNVSNRIQKHFSFLRKNKHTNPILQNIFNKYGEESFLVDIIEYIDSKDKVILKSKEKEYQMQCTTCISMDANDYVIKNRSKESYINSIAALNNYREQALDICRTPVIVYFIEDCSHKLYKQLDDILGFFESKHAYKNLKDKILIPYKGMVCFYPSDFTEDNINKIIQSKSKTFTSNRGSYILYNIITSKILYFSSKTQFSLNFSDSKNDKLFDMYQNLIDENFNTTEEVLSIDKLMSMDFIFSRTKTNIKKCNLAVYYNALLLHKTAVDTAKKLGVDRKFVTELFKRKSIKDRINEVDSLIARVKSV